MMKRFAPILGALFWVGIFSGCAHFQKTVASKNVPGLSPEKLQLRNNSVSLLDDLLNDEKNVSKILLIKHTSEELDRLIKKISTTSDAGEKQLEQLAANDPTLKLHALELPAGEKATRDAIAKTKEYELLFSSGEIFEFNLLFTQADALSYGWHLSKIAAENSSRPEEVRQFTAISKALDDLYMQVIARMRSLPAK